MVCAGMFKMLAAKAAATVCNTMEEGMKMRRFLLVPVLALAVAIAACNTSWIQTAQQYIAVLAPAIEDVIGILQIAGVRGISQTDVNTVARFAAEATADLSKISVLLTQYNSANAVTTAQQIDAAANDAKQNLSSILPAIHVTDPKTVSKVTAAVDLAVNTITELEALVPVKTQKTAYPSRAQRPPSPSQLQKQFNNIFAQ
ncbi:MAG: hypothetical protein KGM47_10105 [Acidobacteriota bacterium]|nr:hypothetical protein [Acidobacteriota bacterium]